MVGVVVVGLNMVETYCVLSYMFLNGARKIGKCIPHPESELAGYPTMFFITYLVVSGISMD